MWAFLFDLDGTLADTNAVHEVAWRDVFSDFGIELSSAGFRTHISGRSNPDIVRHFLPHLDVEQARGLIHRKESLFRERAQHLAAPEGLVPLVMWAVTQRVQLGVVTNAPRANASHVLKVLNLDRHFDVVIGAEDVTQAKPHPQPYLCAAERLSVSVGRCIAFEDSPAGVASAVAAGIVVAGLTTGHSAGELGRAGAAPVVASFSDERLLTVLRSMIASE